VNLLWDQEPLVAPADFSPLTGALASPIEPDDPAAQARPSAKPDAVTRPRRLNLLELGLAHGAGAMALEAAAHAVDAARRERDRARRQQDGSGHADRMAGGAEEAALGEEAIPGRGVRAEGQRVQAVAALASEIRTTLAATKRLTGELAKLEVKQEELRRQLTALLEDGRGLRQDGGRAVLT
jgi:hypothetical protein